MAREGAREYLDTDSDEQLTRLEAAALFPTLHLPPAGDRVDYYLSTSNILWIVYTNSILMVYARIGKYWLHAKHIDDYERYYVNTDQYA